MDDENSDILEDLKRCGAVEMDLEETCQICNITMDQFLENPEFIKMYQAGQLESKFRIRQAIVKLAKEGVPQMVKIYQDFKKISMPERDNTEYEEILPDLEGVSDDE